MIDLSGLAPFASGYNRHCYQHPDDPALCLKVLRPENIEARFQRQAWPKKVLGKARIDDNRQELRAHQQQAIRRLLARNQGALVWAHLPLFYGSVETSRGHANKSELIRCADGSVAPTLQTCLSQVGLTPSLRLAIDEFIHWLKRTRILTRNLLPHNLVVTDRTGEPQLFLVDGLGAPTFPTALSTLPGWSSHHISRKIGRFEKRLVWEQNPDDLSWEDFQRRR
ncbi:YrbL family protein [Marinobacter orientalis]|uniref:PhoP regulatory network protein YrbL n=1 Tax=Marinobacter orientalis TaxID=1928859 RepID=A0A7Y0WTX1_9GAMM|nr:YrbL family protein [Marinobacter orientalis]NMT65291.1 hypothetical protein [Marinobacter orientalis]TGX47937.1 hypothetical protein DIT72_17125 [Marinobacter orientalis]